MASSIGGCSIRIWGRAGDPEDEVERRVYHARGSERPDEPHPPLGPSLTATWAATHLKTPERFASDGVGSAVARAPLHRSGRAELPHPAPALSKNAESHAGMRMTDPGGRKHDCSAPPASARRACPSTADAHCWASVPGCGPHPGRRQAGYRLCRVTSLVRHHLARALLQVHGQAPGTSSSVQVVFANDVLCKDKRWKGAERRRFHQEQSGPQHLRMGDEDGDSTQSQLALLSEPERCSRRRYPHDAHLHRPAARREPVPLSNGTANALSAVASAAPSPSNARLTQACRKLTAGEPPTRPVRSSAPAPLPRPRSRSPRPRDRFATPALRPPPSARARQARGDRSGSARRRSRSRVRARSPR